MCVVGSGGREHALALALGRTADVVVTPGNPGIGGTTPEGHTITSVDRRRRSSTPTSSSSGPRRPSSTVWPTGSGPPAGWCSVPGADGARLEGSKAFMKEMLAEADVPTARFGVFTEAGPAKAFLRSLPGPWVVKTDGLAAGKGVLVTESLADAEADIDAKLSGEAFGDAGRQVVVEEGTGRPGVLAAGPVRRAPAGRPGPGPGLQTARRPRPWSEHRRHGGLLAGARRSTTAWSTAWWTRRWPRWWLRCGPGDRLPGRALRRADADAGRAQGARVQRAVR